MKSDQREDAFRKKADITEICVDMHCHSSWSDGTLPPAAVAKRMAESGVTFASLTDHDTTAGLIAFSHALEVFDIGYIPGLEITARHHGNALHILAYGFDPENAVLEALLDRKTSDQAEKVTPHSMYKSPDEVIDIIHRAGGIAVLAHPFTTQPDPGKLTELIDELKNAGLDGIEAQYGRYTPEQNRQLMEIAQTKALIPTAGTDFHDPAHDSPGMVIKRTDWNAFRDALLHAPSMKDAASEQPPAKMKQKNKWFSFGLNMVLPAFLSLAMLIAALFLFLLPYDEQTLMDIKRESIRDLSQVAYGVLSEAVDEVESGEMTLEDAQALAKNRISAMRYGADDKDYFWLQDTTPKILMHPYRTDLNDQDVSAFADEEGTQIFVEFSNLALSEGEGFVSYVWQWMDDPDRVEAKESYIRYFEPWGWIIGTGIYATDVQTEINQLRRIIEIISFAVIGVVLLLLIYLIRQGVLLEKSKQEAANLLQESTQRYRTLSEAATEGALFVSDGRCRYANAMLYEMLGCPYNKIDLLFLTDLFPDTDVNAAWLRFLSGGVRHAEERSFDGVIRRCDGTLLNCRLAIKTGLNNCSGGLMILVRRRRAEDAAEHTGTKVALDRLLHIPGMMASELSDSIKSAKKATEVAALCRKTSRLVVSQLETGTSSLTIASMIATITDSAARKLIALAIQKLGPPPAPFAFLALGSQGRQAQTLFSDQDNALIYKPGDEVDAENVQMYFRDLAALVCDNLETAGYEKCRGGMIASNTQWCKPLSNWKNDFSLWIREGQPKQIMEFCSLLDFRTVYGERELETEIRDFIYAEIEDDRPFLKQLAQNAVAFKMPQRLFGSIKAAGETGINVKKPAFAIVSFARFYAVRHGIKETNTLLQLDAIKRLGVISDAKHRDIVTAYEMLLRLRLWSQVLAIQNNEKSDNNIAQSQLGKVEGAVLRESLKEIDSLQSMIGREFLGLV